MEKLELKDYILMITDRIGRLPAIDKSQQVCDDLIPKGLVLDILKNTREELDASNERLPKTYTKVMYIEDGSLDVKELESELPDTKIIVYRQGSAPPELRDIQSNPIKGY